MKRLIFIHSYDHTTKFLQAILEFLQEKGLDNFDYFSIFDRAENAQEIRTIIASAEFGSTIVFLGHGASHCTYLPYTGSRAAEFFINKDSFGILKRKNFICLSCRSAEFIREHFDPVGNTAMIGFDDLPTHWEDVVTEREIVNHKAYAGMTDQVLAFFRKCLVKIFAKSLYDAISNNLDFNKFYLRLRLYSNREVFRVVNYSISDNPTLLANTLYELKNGVLLLGNSSSLVI